MKEITNLKVPIRTDADANWLSYYGHLILEAVLNVKDQDIFVYDITGFATHYGHKSGEWYVDDINQEEGYLAELGCELVLSTKELPLEYIAHIKL